MQTHPVEFQLYHTGIKTDVFLFQCFTGLRFQLHHTGIKTCVVTSPNRCVVTFQLHHTGIKTDKSPTPCLKITYFNCTIQELKPFDNRFPSVFHSISIAPYRN